MSDPEQFAPVPDPRPADPPWPTMTWPVPPVTRLTGRWVVLTPTDPALDAAGIYRALDDDRVWAHLAGRPASPDQLAATLRERAARPDWQQWTLRAARVIGDVPAGTFLGSSSYLEVSPADARLEIGSTAYCPAVWGTAVNPEAKLLLLGFAFDTLAAGRVQLKTDVRNVRSQQAIARLGARYEGTLRRYQRRGDGTVRDTVLFSVTAQDWPQVRRRLQARLAGPLREDPGRPG